MILSRTAEYALRATAHLAASPPGAWRTAADIAAGARIPTNYVSKVMRRLVSAGILHGRKGHGGGFVLSRPPQELRVIDVLVAVDEAPDVNRCFSGLDRCGETPCPLHHVIAALKESVLHWSSEQTFAAPFRLPPG